MKGRFLFYKKSGVCVWLYRFVFIITFLILSLSCIFYILPVYAIHASQISRNIKGGGVSTEIEKRDGRPAANFNKHKSGFIKKIKKMIESGAALTPQRYARLKNEIIKLRERLVKRITQIDKKTAELNAERTDILSLLQELDTCETRFDKIKISDSNSGSGEVKISR